MEKELAKIFFQQHNVQNNDIETKRMTL